ncbi:hypothetical protein SAMN06265346_101141 [Flavobacterium hercynium]|nr:hypothetical protein SAMN06265346_101141 [Flavobacterium hercynium]
MYNLFHIRQTIKTIILLTFISNVGFAQQTNKTASTIIKKWGEVDIKPDYRGDEARFYAYVGSNFTRIDSEDGKIKATFVIEKDGCLSNIEIVENEAGVLSGKELIRVLERCYSWKPGYHEGVPVRVAHSVKMTLQ